MTTSKEDKLRDKLRKLFALMGSENTAEREAARAKIVELLGKNKKTWNDLAEFLATGNAKGWHDDEPAAVGGGKATPAPLELINHILERHLHLTNAQRIAMTLWIAHTFKYHEFSVTPRLHLAGSRLRQRRPHSASLRLYPSIPANWTPSRRRCCSG